MTKRMTGKDYRESGKKRAAAFKEAQAEKGFRPITFYIHDTNRAIIEGLKKETGCSTQQAFDLIFQTYEEANTPQVEPEPQEQAQEQKTPPPAPTKPAQVEPDPEPQQPAPEFKNQVETKPQDETPLPDIGDHHGKELTTEEKDAILIGLYKALPGRKYSAKRVEILNAAGVTCGKAKTAWTPKKFKDNLHHAKKRQGGAQ